MGAYGNNANDLRAYSRSPFFILGSSWSLFGNKTTIIVIIRAGINSIFIVNTEGDLLDVSTGTLTTYSQQVLFYSLSESSFIFIGIHFLNLFSLSTVNQTLPTYVPLINFSYLCSLASTKHIHRRLNLHSLSTVKQRFPLEPTQHKFTFTLHQNIHFILRSCYLIHFLNLYLLLNWHPQNIFTAG